MKLFKLKGREVVPEDDPVTWASWYETANRTVARTLLRTGEVVETVFLGYDPGDGHLFKTTGGGQTVTYDTWAAAEHGHANAVARLGGAAVHQPPSVPPTPGAQP